MVLEEQLVELLLAKDYHIAFAESCTAGLCCATLVNVTDASKVLNVSFTTYSNESKIKYLGVSADTILKHGVVSEEVAREMAAGVAKTSGSEVGIGVTGIAGPSGGTAKKPVGMVCFGFYVNGQCETFTRLFGDIGRNNVRSASVEFVFRTLNKMLAR